MSTYSIRYPNVDFPYGDCAVDWDWKIQNRWARSQKEAPASPWVTEEGLDEKAYQQLLNHFSLDHWADEFPPQRIISMSPGDLATERRKKENQYQLPRKTMVSDTLGYHVQADNHEPQVKIEMINTSDKVVAWLHLEDREEYGDHYEDGAPLAWTREVWKKVTIGPEPYDPKSLSRSVPITGKEAVELLLESDRILLDTIYTKLGVTSLRDYPGLPKGLFYDPVNLDDIRSYLIKALYGAGGG